MNGFLRVCAAFLGLGFTAGCRDYHESQQRTTATVSNPSGDGPRSSVVKVEALFGQLPASASEFAYGSYREAAVVEVLPARFLIV